MARSGPGSLSTHVLNTADGIPAEGMVVQTATPRAQHARRMVFELLLADQPGAGARDPYWRTARVDPRSDPKARGGAWTPWL